MSSVILDDDGTLRPMSSKSLAGKPMYERAALMKQQRNYQSAVKRMKGGVAGGDSNRESGGGKRKIGRRTWLPGAFAAVAFSSVFHLSICEEATAARGSRVGSLFDVCITDPRKDALWSDEGWRDFVQVVGKEGVKVLRDGMRRTIVMDLFVLAIVNKGLSTR